MIDRVADIYGEPTPHARATVWPARIDEYLGEGVSADEVDHCDNDRALMKEAGTVMEQILRAAGAEDVLTFHRAAHLVGGAPGAPTRRPAWWTRTAGPSWYSTCSSPMAACCPPRVRRTRRSRSWPLPPGPQIASSAERPPGNTPATRRKHVRDSCRPHPQPAP